MEIYFSKEAWEDYLYWQKTDKAILKSINNLIKDIQRNHFTGIGKPEQLKHSLQGFWSRRISLEHRIVYKISNDTLQILQLRYHY